MWRPSGGGRGVRGRSLGPCCGEAGGERWAVGGQSGFCLLLLGRRGWRGEESGCCFCGDECVGEHFGEDVLNGKEEKRREDFVCRESDG